MNDFYQLLDNVIPSSDNIPSTCMITQGNLSTGFPLSPGEAHIHFFQLLQACPRVFVCKNNTEEIHGFAVSDKQECGGKKIICVGVSMDEGTFCRDPYRCVDRVHYYPHCINVTNAMLTNPALFRRMYTFPESPYYFHNQQQENKKET
jgi:hypothetical protein